MCDFQENLLSINNPQNFVSFTSLNDLISILILNYFVVVAFIRLKSNRVVFLYLLKVEVFENIAHL